MLNYTIMEIHNNLQQQFKQLFNDVQDSRLFFAPGRVNLIGEHTDYNGGYVFPCAINLGTYALVRQRNDRLCKFYSLNFDQLGLVEFSLDNLAFQEHHDWANYPKGVMVEAEQRGINFAYGWEIVFWGNLPNGAGLSSSASIEVLMATIINTYYGQPFSGVEMALMAQAAENNYIGVGCGIMDQFASAMGKANCAILLDCNSLEYQYVPLNLAEYTIVITNTNKRRGLVDSKYNERLAECQKALQILQTNYSISALCQLNEQQLQGQKHLFNHEPVIYQRAYHAVSENQRVLSAVAGLKNGVDLKEFGQLMGASHTSLAQDYAVTGIELDSLVASAWRQSGCIGARMTGAGFGGCSVNLVKQTEVANFIQQVGLEYTQATGLVADFYVVKPSAEAREIKINVEGKND